MIVFYSTLAGLIIPFIFLKVFFREWTSLLLLLPAVGILLSLAIADLRKLKS